MLGTQNLVQNSLAVATEVIAAAPVPSEQGLAESKWRRLLISLTFELLSYRIPHELGQPGTADAKPRSQVSFELDWQTDCNRHGTEVHCNTSA
jgi:hypothetical protein